MLTDVRLRAALKKAPLVSFTGFVTRFVYEIYRHGPMPKGARLVGQRYNPEGVHAVYTSFTRACALAEFTQYVRDDQAMAPASMLSIAVKLGRVLDLCDSDTQALLGTSTPELCGVRIPGVLHPAQRLGAAAADLGIDGIIAPSAAFAGGKNLVIFPDTHIVPPYTVVRSIHSARS